MAADGTVNIDVILNDLATDKAKKIDDLLKKLGQDAGDQIDEQVKGNLDQAVRDTHQAHEQMADELKQPVKQDVDADTKEADEKLKKTKEEADQLGESKPKIKPEADTDSADEKTQKLIKRYKDIPKELKTQLIANANEAGISNFDKLLRKIPKKQLTELIAKAQKGEVINYAELLHKLPAKVVTEVKLNNKASTELKEIQQQAKSTSSTFSHLKEIIAGTFAGQLLAQGLSALKNGLIEATKAGMEYNIEQDRMRTVWKSLTEEAPRDGERLVNFINQTAQHSIYASESLDRMAQSFYHVHSNEAETERWTKDFVALGSTLHVTNDALAEAGEQFSKIMAGGKANAEDMQVMINRFPMFGEALQKVTGKTMQQLYDLSSQGKLTADDFGKAIDYLGKKYKNGTEEAMTSFTGMSMYIQSRWQVLWGNVMNTSFNANKKMSEDLRDLLSDQMIAKYSDLLGKAMGTLLEWVMKVLNYIGDHKKTLVDFIGNLFKLAGIIGQAVWESFASVLHIIGAAFGAVTDNGKKAADPLELLDNVVKALVKHKTEVQLFTKALIAMFAVKRIMDFVMWMAKAKDALLAFSATEKIAGMLSGGLKLPIGGVGSTGIVLGAQTLTRAVPIASAAIGVGSELTSNHSTSQKVGGSVGSIGGTALGAFAGSFLDPLIGPTGTAIGATAGSWVGKKLGEAAGDAANKALKGKSIVATTKVKVDADTQNLNRRLGPSFNKLNTLTLKMDIDQKSINNTKAKTDKLFDDMSKSVDKYYADKEKKAQKDLQQLVKQGMLTQAEADKRLKKMQETDQRGADLRKKSLTKMQNDTNSHYQRLEALQNGSNAKLQKIAQKYGTDSKKYQDALHKALEKENKRYSEQLARDQMNANGKVTKSVSKGADEQRKILQKLSKDKGKLSMQDLKQTEKDAKKQYEAAVKPAQKARDDIIKAAKDKHKQTIKIADEEYKKHHSISKKQYTDIVNDADKQRDDTIKAAKDQYNKVTKSAKDQHKKVVHEVESQKNEVVMAANGQATGHAQAASNEYSMVNKNVSSGSSRTASIWNKLGSGINKVLKVFEASQKVPMLTEAYATGTGALVNDQLALVGEEGFELAHTPRGIEVLGKEGPEIRYLSAGTSILTHEQSKQVMALNGGKLPGYAKGTGAKVADFVSGALDSAGDMLEEAFDFIGKSATEIWDKIKNSIGLDRLLDALPRPWLNQTYGKGSIRIAEHSVGNFLKNLADKFAESIGGDGVMSKASFIKAAQVAAHLMGQTLSGHDIEHLYWQAFTESTVNPAQNGGYDDHDGTGLPIGLFQFKRGTWAAATRHLPSNHHNIHSAVDQIMAVLADRNWRSDFPPIGVKRGWSPSAYANGGWADKPSIFGEVPGEPELAINPRRDTADGLIAEAIEARAQVDPNGLAGKLTKLIDQAKRDSLKIGASLNTSRTIQKQANASNIDLSKLNGDMNITMQVDGAVVGRVMYPRFRALQNQEALIRSTNGAIPVGRAMPVGGMY